MIKTFVLLATIWNPDIHASEAYILDYDMNGTDCTETLLDVYHADEIELEPGFIVKPSDVILSCEIDDFL